MLNETYYSDGAFRTAQARRESVRKSLGRLVRWKPIDSPGDGYTLIIPCFADLKRILIANLQLVARQRRDHLRNIIVSCDQGEMGFRDLAAEIRNSFGELPVQWVHPTKMQLATLRMAGSPVTLRWLVVAGALALVRTRYAICHELCAMLGREDVFEDRYRTIVAREDHFVGAAPAAGDGLVPADALADEAEMIFDAANLRERCDPADVMATVAVFRGRRLDLPGLIHPQTIAGRSSIAALGERDVIRPRRAVEQYLQATMRSDYVPPADCDLPMLPYLRYLGLEPGILSQSTHAFADPQDGVVTLADRAFDFSALTRDHAMGLVRQADQLEMVMKRAMRPEVKAYFQSILRFVQHRAGAGTASGPAAGAKA